MSVKVRLAVPGDGASVHRLGELALGGFEGPATQDEGLGGYVDAHGGRVKVPFGTGHVFVACPAGGSVSGLLYTTPPVLLISNVQGASAEERTRLGVALAEIQLLAVDVDKRGQGLATRLLRSCEVALSLRGCQYLLVKMNRDQSVVDWYAARGFQVLDDGQPFALRFEGRVVVFKDEPDEFRVGVKALTRGGY